MGESLVLQVSVIPASLYYKMVRDKLLIHFLRRSNGGGGEVDVRYPTEEEGVATLTFNQEKVANRVLSRGHQLEMEGYFYPLEVSRLQCRGTQVSKPLMALSLDEDEGSDSNGRPGYRSDGSSQRRPNNTSTEDSTAIKSNMAANLHFHPGPTKKIPTDGDRRPGRNSPPASNGKPADSSGLPRHTTFARTHFREDLPESGQLKDTFAADSDSRQRKPKGNIADGFTSNPKHPIGDGSDFNPGQPKNTSTDELNPKHSKSTIDDGTKFRSGQPKNTSTDELNPKHSKSAIDDGTKFRSGQPKNTSTDELNSTPKHSKSAIGDSDKLNSGQPNNTSLDDFKPNPKHSNTTIGDSNKFTSGQCKKTSADEFNSSPNHSESTIGDGTNFNYGQPKNTSTDELMSNPNHSKSAAGDGTKFNPGQPKNTSTDELNLNPKLPKNALGDGANFKPGKPQNSSPDEFYLNPRDPEDQTARSSYRSSIMAAGWSSSSSPTFNSLTASNPKSHPDPSPLSTDFLVDPAAHTYISVFMKDEINNILAQSGVEMKTETGDGFSRVILTTKSPHLSQNFYKAAREISDIFMKCQSFLRVESIDLSNISSNVTKKLQLYLLRCGIWSSPNGERLQMIGPYEDIVEFMKKWTSAGGDFVRLMHLLHGVSPASSRPPVVGRDNVHQSTTRNHNVTHDVHTQRARSKDRREETGARGGGRRPDSISRSKTPSDKHWK